MNLTPEERGLSLEARFTPRGSPPGGASSTRALVSIEGRAAKAWSPGGLKVAPGEGGLAVSWRARRTDHDGWDAADPLAHGPYRLRGRRDGTWIDLRQTGETGTTLSQAELIDVVEIGVAEWRETSGWGEEARMRL